MARNYQDWLGSFLDYCKGGEVPRHVSFWTGVVTIAACLRRHTFIDMKRFKWYPNFYIIIVAPPAIVAKSTTSDQGMRLLKKVPGIVFGPHVTTWESLVTRFASSAEGFSVDGQEFVHSPLILDSGEFGNLFDPKDRKQVDIFVRLYDCPEGTFEKETKMSGCDSVMNPCINLIACTTPAWIADNFPRYLVGGGFTSRCIFVYVDEKAELIAYPDEHVIQRYDETAMKLIQDLEHISVNLKGGYTILPEARVWGREWYEQHYTKDIRKMGGAMLQGYAGRKQAHIHKLAMVLAASQSDHMQITREHLQTATAMITDLEKDMPKVFDNIGRSEISVNAEKLLQIVKDAGVTGIPYTKAYSQVHMYFPSAHDFEQVMAGAVKSGFIVMRQVGNAMVLFPGPSLLES